MYAIRCFRFLSLGLVILIGCAKTPDKPKGDASNATSSKAKEMAPEQETKIQAGLAKLTDADRALALAQKFCPIQQTRLGSMGKPDRVEIDGQPVFLCCSGCEDEARAEPKKTLEQVARFKQGVK